MPRIVVSSDFKALERALKDVVRKQVPFAASQALTLTARDARDDVRRDVPRKFTVRSKGVLSGFQSTRAEKRDWPSLSAEVGTRDDFWRLQETGGIKRPRRGKNLAIPTKATRRSKSGKIPKGKRPRPLISSGKAAAADGVVRKVSKQRRANGLQILFLLRRKARIEPQLGMAETVERSVGRRYERRFRVALERAIKAPKRPRRLQR